MKNAAFVAGSFPGVALDADGKLIDTSTLPDRLKLLQRQGWLTLEQRRERQYFCVAPERRTQVWNPAVEDQASDRAHRMGQQRPVTICRLVIENSIEEQIVALHGRKRDLADSLLEGGEMGAKLDADALLALLKG